MSVKVNSQKERTAPDYAHRVVTGRWWMPRQATLRTSTATPSGMAHSCINLPSTIRFTTVGENVDLTCKRILALTYLRGVK